MSESNIVYDLAKGTNTVPHPIKTWSEHVETLCKGNLKRMIWSPNWSVSKPFDKPEGYVLVLDGKTPLIAGILSEEKLFSGTSAFSLLGMKTKNGTPFDRAYIEKERNAIEQIFRDKVPQTTEKPPVIGYYNPKTTRDNDNSDWKTSLSGTETPTASGSPFAGLYTSVTTESNKRVEELWLVTYTNSVDISKYITNRMKEVFKSGKTLNNFSEFFFKSPEVTYLSILAQRHRKKLLYDICEKLNLSVPTINDEKGPKRGDQKKPTYDRLVEPTIDIGTNMLLMKGDKIYYYDNCFDSKKINGRFILNESPTVGCTIYEPPVKGVNWFQYLEDICKTKQSGSLESVTANYMIENMNYYSGLFPVNMGTICYTDLKSSVPPTGVNVMWDDLGMKTNSRMMEGKFRSKSNEFKVLLNQLGHMSIWGETELKPLIVKVASDLIE